MSDEGFDMPILILRTFVGKILDQAEADVIADLRRFRVMCAGARYDEKDARAVFERVRRRLIP